MTVGILGGGQLARMLGLAGIPLGIRFVVYDPAKNVGGAAIGEHICAPYDDLEALGAFARAVDVATYEFENVPVEAATFVEQFCPVLPDKKALYATQDRLRENELFRSLDIPTPQFQAVNSIEDVATAAEALGYPLVLKTRSGGYDGKGQVVIRSADTLEVRWAESAQQHLIAEEFIAFDREVSIIAARRKSGDIAFYDIAENVHRDGILRTSRNRIDDPIQHLAEQHVSRLMDDLGYYGVIGLECFQVGDQLLANEYAPRVHNTGHWSIDGAVTSQFENHLRAILDLPLGSTAPLGFSAMLNCIGALPTAADCLSIPGVHYHSYDKAPRPGRKVGHVNVVAETPESLEDAVTRLPDFFRAVASARSEGR